MRCGGSLVGMGQSAQHGAALPHHPAPLGEQRWLPTASTFVVVDHARCSSHRTRDHRWPCVQFNCSSCVEQFANGSAVFWVTDIFRRCLKTELFERSYNWHCACQTTLLLCDSLSLSRSFLLWPQPWSLSTIMLLWHPFLKIIIIIRTDIGTTWHSENIITSTLHSLQRHKNTTMHYYNNVPYHNAELSQIISDI